MSNFREVNDSDILYNWYVYRDEMTLSIMTEQDKVNEFIWSEFYDNILNDIPEENKKYVEDQLNLIYDDFMRYVTYENEKYYRNGFCDGVELISRSFNK